MRTDRRLDGLIRAKPKRLMAAVKHRCFSLLMAIDWFTSPIPSHYDNSIAQQKLLNHDISGNKNLAIENISCVSCTDERRGHLISLPASCACGRCGRFPTAWFTQNGWASVVDSTADFLNRAQLSPFVKVTGNDGFGAKSLLTNRLHAQYVVVRQFSRWWSYQALKQCQ